jgi:hypothetical protein
VKRQYGKSSLNSNLGETSHGASHKRPILNMAASANIKKVAPIRKTAKLPCRFPDTSHFQYSRNEVPVNAGGKFTESLQVLLPTVWPYSARGLKGRLKTL